jgi:hypothetical protein
MNLSSLQNQDTPVDFQIREYLFNSVSHVLYVFIEASIKSPAFILSAMNDDAAIVFIFS